MRSITDHRSASTWLRSVCILGSVALAACGDQSTAPRFADHAPKAAYDRNAYVETLSSEQIRAGSLANTLSSLDAISTLSSPNVIVNGSFEDNGGSLSGWTVFNEPGGSGTWFVQTGTTSPLIGFVVPAPTAGAHAAMTDQPGPGSHVLYQDVTVPAGASVSFDLFIANRAGAFFTPASLSFMVFPNEQARVDIMTTASSVTSVTTGVIANLYQSVVGDPITSGYTSHTTSLTALAGQTVRLRFSEVDNQSFFNMGIDNVSLSVSYVGLCASIQTLVSKPGIQNSLCAKLTNAAAAEARGNATAQNGILAAFVNEVEAQTDAAITPASASLLISAAQSLMAP